MEMASRSSSPLISSNHEMKIIRKALSMDSIEVELDSYQEKMLSPSASLPRTPVKSGLKGTHKKTPSLDWCECGYNNDSYHNQEEEDNISDSDTEDKWTKEGALCGPQSTYV